MEKGYKSKQAFPTNENDFEGMSLLDYFAAKAMQGAITNLNIHEDARRYAEDTNQNKADVIARESYLFAEAMLKEREKHI